MQTETKRRKTNARKVQTPTFNKKENGAELFVQVERKSLNACLPCDE